MTDAARIRALSAEGHSRADIAQQLGLSRQAVSVALKRRGKLGRPAKGVRCPTCGAQPAHQVFKAP